jgi:aminoglycoside phosphotransferase family enzyme/predicted kinase
MVETINEYRRPVMRGFGPTCVGTDVAKHAVREALGRSEFRPNNPLDEVHETQTAWVFLAGDRAYKVKKPVRMEVPDFSTLEQRRLACLEELRVNHELAPAIGLRVRAMVPRLGSMVLADDGARGAVEYAIEMRRFDDAQTMASLVQHGLLTDAHVVRVAQRLAAFHASAPRFSTLDPVVAVMRASQRNVRELLALTSEDAARSVRASALFTDAFLLTHGHEIAARADAGFIRDGHGDLRAAHVVFGERLAIVGRHELDPRLREIDVAEDVACLVMDLERIGDHRAAELLVQRYWEAGGELCSPELLAIYGARRALLRATVELLRAHHLGDEAAASARDRADELLRHAERLAWRARGPIVLMIERPAVSGESTLAAELSRRSGFEVLSSDLLRDEHLRPAAATAAESADAPGQRAQLYRELGERAREVVINGRSVIVEATLGHPRLRAEFVRGLRDSGVLHAFEHHVPPELRGRTAHGSPPDAAGADATPAVTADGATYSAWDEVRGKTILTVRPSAGVEHVVDQIAGWLDARQSAVHPAE